MSVVVEGSNGSDVLVQFVDKQLLDIFLSLEVIFSSRGRRAGRFVDC